MNRTALLFEQVDSIKSVSAGAWDACVTDGNPFVSHAFLSAVEKFGVATQAKGYVPRHIIVRRDSELVAAAPVYLKSHSEAEIGSDFGWSLAHERSIGPYYPKLQVETPATPTPGPRILVKPAADEIQVRASLIEALRVSVQSASTSSLHANFLKPDEWLHLKAAGFICDIGIRFAWKNAGYVTFADFLADLKSDRRGMINRERREFNKTGLVFERLEGAAISPQFIDDFFPLYASTYTKYGTPALLTSGVFHHLRETLQDQMMFTTARLHGRLAAAVMFMHGGGTLYALHWGSCIEQRFLHYELTYYQGIEFAIERGFVDFDAGPVGAHKPPRGLLAIPSLNAHWFRNEEFGRLIARGSENRVKSVQAQISQLDRLSPFKPGLIRQTMREDIYGAL